MKRETVEFMLLLLREFGLKSGDSKKCCRSYIIVMGMVLSLPFYLIQILQNRNFFTLVICIAYLCIQIFTSCNFFYFMIRKEFIQEQLLKIEDNIFTYKEEEKIVTKYGWVLLDKNEV